LAGAVNRYAKAIFELAGEEGRIEEWGRSLGVIRSVLEDPAAQSLFENPSVPAETRLAAIETLDLPGIGPDGMNLMKMLVVAGRTSRIGEIVTQYETLADAAAGRVRATVTTAIPLSESGREALARDLSSSLGKDVRLVSQVDPSILGGLILQVGDRLTDASVAARLEQIRRQVLVS
jgi:F-type H+-transporting ATPase subunit delta